MQTLARQRVTEQSKLYVHKKSGSTIAAIETDDGAIQWRRLELPADGHIVSKEAFNQMIKDMGYSSSGSGEAELAKDAGAAASISAAAAAEKEEKDSSSSSRSRSTRK